MDDDTKLSVVLWGVFALTLICAIIMICYPLVA